jgi:hypothetical protein
MDDYYYFFDRSAVDSLWKMSWQEFLRLHGDSDWAKYPKIGSADDSLRGLIAFALDPEPSAAEVEDIIHRRTVRGTIERSSPQFYVMEEIVRHIPRLRKSHTSLDVWEADFTVLLAAAADGYFRGDVPATQLETVLKLHYSKFEDFIRLTKQERSVLRHLMDVDKYAKPIYPWQGPGAILDEQWAWCLGVADTRRFFTLVDRLWKRNPEVGHLHDLEQIELCKPKQATHRFRDFGISRHMMNLWSRKVRSFEHPSVFRRGE